MLMQAYISGKAKASAARETVLPSTNMLFRFVAERIRLSLISFCFFFLLMPGQTLQASFKPFEESEWTIMIFLNADNNLEGFGIQDFYEMASVAHSQKVNVLVQFDRWTGLPVWPDQNRDWTQTLRFVVTDSLVPLSANALADLGEVNMGDGASLTSFVKWGMASHPAKKFMLVIWNHGQGWRIGNMQPIPLRNRQTVLASREILLKRQTLGYSTESQGAMFEAALVDPTPIPPTVSIPGAVRYVSSDDDSNDHLYNQELAESLVEAIGDRKLDVIGFDACLMGMIETAYAVKDVAGVMVASEELEPGPGWNYRIWLQKLIANPSIDGAQLGRLLVESYKENFEASSGDVTLSAIDLGMADRIAAMITNLSQVLIRKMDSQFDVIRRARENTWSYAPGYYLHGIDLARFVSQVRKETKDNEVIKAAAAVERAIDDAIIHNWAGILRQAEYGSHGIAIYFPATLTLFENDPDSEGYLESNSLYPVRFVTDHAWDNFLQAYYAHVP